jgi:hypothetical protein
MKRSHIQQKWKEMTLSQNTKGMVSKKNWHTSTGFLKF